jgi:hypothetical protein
MIARAYIHIKPVAAGSHSRPETRYHAVEFAAGGGFGRAKGHDRIGLTTGRTASMVSLSAKAAMSTAKQDVESLLNRLPDNVSVEDIQYHLYVLDKVRRGLEDARINGTLSQEEVESRFSKWLTE